MENMPTSQSLNLSIKYCRMLDRSGLNWRLETTGREPHSRPDPAVGAEKLQIWVWSGPFHHLLGIEAVLSAAQLQCSLCLMPGNKAANLHLLFAIFHLCHCHCHTWVAKCPYLRTHIDGKAIFAGVAVAFQLWKTQSNQFLWWAE
jgi:hypothetical protein